MGRVLLGVCVGIALSAPSVWALRIASPPTFREWNTNTFSQLNDVFLQLWNIGNGRYQMDVVTSDPDGSRRGDVGEAVLFDTATNRLCVNVDGAKLWHCVDIS